MSYRTWSFDKFSNSVGIVPPIDFELRFLFVNSDLNNVVA